MPPLPGVEHDLGAVQDAVICASPATYMTAPDLVSGNQDHVIPTIQQQSAPARPTPVLPLVGSMMVPWLEGAIGPWRQIYLPGDGLVLMDPPGVGGL